MSWITVAPGIRCRDHDTRKHGVKPDRYFTIRIYVDGRRVEEALGWASEGWTLKRAQEERGKLHEAKRTGEGKATLREKREAAAVGRQVEALRIAEEARQNITLAGYFAEHYEPWALATKPKAFATEAGLWRLWINPNLGDLPINAIGIKQWDHLMKTVVAGGLSERSKEYIAGTLRRILKHALERRVIAETPPTGRMVGATAPKNNRRLRVLTDAELQAFLIALKARDLNSWRVTLFAAGTGCRASEAFNLRWGNVNLDAGTVTFTKTKNGQARTVPLGEEIRDMLAEVTRGGHADLVFPSNAGTPYGLAPTAFRGLVDDLKLNEGRDEYDRFTFHSLRHMAATRLARVLPLRGLMDVLGWTQATMALRYSHTSDSDMKTAAEAMNTAFQPQAEAKVIPMPVRRGARSNIHRQG